MTPPPEPTAHAPPTARPCSATIPRRTRCGMAPCPRRPSRSTSPRWPCRTRPSTARAQAWLSATNKSVRRRGDARPERRFRTPAPRDLHDGQQDMLLEVVREWAGIMTEAFATPRMAQIGANLPQTFFAWSGPTTNGSAGVLPHPGTDAGDRIRTAGRRRSHSSDLPGSDQRLRREIRRKVAGPAPINSETHHESNTPHRFCSRRRPASRRSSRSPGRARPRRLATSGRPSRKPIGQGHRVVPRRSDEDVLPSAGLSGRARRLRADDRVAHPDGLRCRRPALGARDADAFSPTRRAGTRASRSIASACWRTPTATAGWTRGPCSPTSC